VSSNPAIVRYDPAQVLTDRWEMGSMSESDSGDYVKLEDHQARIAKLEKEVAAQRWLLDQCNQELECAGVTYVELRCYLKGTMTADDLVNLSTEPEQEP